MLWRSFGLCLDRIGKTLSPSWDAVTSNAIRGPPQVAFKSPSTAGAAVAGLTAAASMPCRCVTFEMAAVALVLLVAIVSADDGAPAGYGASGNSSAPTTAASAPAAGAASTPEAPEVNITELSLSVLRAQREPTPHIFNLRTEYSSGGSSISVGEDMPANTLMVQFKFSACTGTQLHHHR